MKKTICLLAGILLALNGCAAEQALLKQTSSGYPEGTFVNTTPEEVQSKLQELCITNGFLIYQSTPSMVVCGKPIEGMQAVLANMYLGADGQDASPGYKLQFNLVRRQNDVFVIAYQFLEAQTRFGQIRRAPWNKVEDKNGVQFMLNSIGAR